MLPRRPVRVLVALSGVVLVTYVGYRVIPVNATTVGFAYLLLILIVASTWGFLEAALASILATLVFNFFFLPPVGTFTIADPQNWVALSSFLATAIIASRLSAKAKARASDAIERQRDLERLYAFSRAMLLIFSDRCNEHDYGVRAHECADSVGRGKRGVAVGERCRAAFATSRSIAAVTGSLSSGRWISVWSSSDPESGLTWRVSESGPARTIHSRPRARMRPPGAKAASLMFNHRPRAVASCRKD